MASKLIGIALAIGVFVLFIGLAFPPLIGADSSLLIQTEEMNTSESVEVDDNFRLELDNVDEGESTANVSLTDIETLATASVTVNETETNSTTLEGETVSVTLDSIEDADTATVAVEYAATYGWSDGAKTIAGELDIILVILAFLMIMGAMMAVMEA